MGHASEEFVEDLTPGEIPSIDEQEIPSRETFFRTTRGTHDQGTRRMLALPLIGAVVVFYGFAFLALVANWIDNDRFAILIAAISAPQALAAAVVGFYYGGRRRGS